MGDGWMIAEERLVAVSVFESGMTWTRYLERISRSHSMQIKRYESIVEKDLVRFREFDFPAKVVVLTQARCGDCAWAIPYLSRLLNENPSIERRYFFRDEHPELMELLLSNGKRAIPKLAFLDNECRIIGEWGPYPSPIVAYVREHAGKHDRSEWYPEVMRYYHRDGVRDLIEDLYQAMTKVRDTLLA
jgi:Thioredoxin